MLLFFKHIKENHNDEKLITVLNDVLKNYDINNRILIITINNINNNETLHDNLMKIIKYLRLNLIFSASDIENQKVFYFVHVI